MDAKTSYEMLMRNRDQMNRLGRPYTYGYGGSNA
jgi:hypothetical protein